MEFGEELRFLILALQREGNRQLADALRPLNLTPSQAEVISVLADAQPMTLLGLGARLVCEAGSPSRLVKSMVEAGWIEKLPNPEDGRAVLLRLSPAAAALLPALRAIEAAFHTAIADVVAPQARAQVLEQLWALAGDSASANALRLRKSGG